MKRELKEKLIKGISEIDSKLLPAADKLEVLFDEVCLFNPALKLIGDNPEEMVTRHFLDCLAPYNIIKQQITDEKCNFADLGTGAGFPGLVLASVFENSKFTLVDRMARRTGFLRNTVIRMGLKDRTEILTSEIENLETTYDVITFRAFRPLKDVARVLVDITHPGSLVFIYKSSDENINEDICSLETVAPGKFRISIKGYSVPMLDAERKLLILKRN